MIFVDSNVLIDLLESNAKWGDWSEAQLSAARRHDEIAINVIVYAEIARTFATQQRLDEFLTDAGLSCLPIPTEAAFVASAAHRAYRSAGGARVATLPDFFIGAHAQVGSFRLLTRDATRIRTYFPQVQLITPP